MFDFPEGIGPVECVNVEHEEVLLIPRWVKRRPGDFQVRLGNEFIEVLETLHKLGLDRDRQGPGRRRRGVPARRGGRLPARPGQRWASGCAARPAPAPGSAGPARTGAPREVYLYHVVDNEWSMREYGSQAVVWQTAVNPVVALELLGRRRLGRAPACSARRRCRPCPFLDTLTAYGSPWGMR